MTEQHSEDGWNEYRKLVLSQLIDLNKSVEKLNDRFDTYLSKDISNVKMEIATLKVKAGLWGLLGASIPSSVAIIVHFLRL